MVARSRFEAEPACNPRRSTFFLVRQTCFVFRPKRTKYVRTSFFLTSLRFSPPPFLQRSHGLWPKAIFFLRHLNTHPFLIFSLLQGSVMAGLRPTNGSIRTFSPDDKLVEVTFCGNAFDPPLPSTNNTILLCRNKNGLSWSG